MSIFANIDIVLWFNITSFLPFHGLITWQIVEMNFPQGRYLVRAELPDRPWISNATKNT
jgi:hypothetical protein